MAPLLAVAHQTRVETMHLSTTPAEIESSPRSKVSHELRDAQHDVASRLVFVSPDQVTYPAMMYTCRTSPCPARQHAPVGDASF